MRSSSISPSRPIGHHQDAVGQEDRLRNRVRDQDHRFPDLLPEPQQLDIELISRQRIERGKRLVEQQHLRLPNERLSQRGPLAHPAGQLMRIRVAERFELQDRQYGFHPRRGFRRQQFPGPRLQAVMFASAVSHGSRLWVWNTTPTSFDGAVCKRPNTSTVPPGSGMIRPATILSSVLLPHPLGPRIETNSPRPTSKESRRVRALRLHPRRSWRRAGRERRLPMGRLETYNARHHTRLASSSTIQ